MCKSTGNRFATIDSDGSLTIEKLHNCMIVFRYMVRISVALEFSGFWYSHSVAGGELGRKPRSLPILENLD